MWWPVRARPKRRTISTVRSAGGEKSTGTNARRSFTSPPPGELYVIPSEWSVAEEELEREAGTSHGSPWIYDREVPVVFSGPDVAHLEIDEDGITQARVATTIAHLLGVSAPVLADPTPL